MKLHKHLKIPLYQRFIHYARLGYNALDSRSQSEIRKFILSKKCADGSFFGRDTRPDPYYTLFGSWLSEALGIPPISNIPGSMNQQLRKRSKIDELASFFLSVTKQEKDQSKQSWLKLIRLTFWGNQETSLFYRFFLFILICDAMVKSRFLYLPLRVVLSFYSPSAGAPCSIHAATLLAKHEVSLKTERQKELLFLFYKKDQGFKAFEHLSDPDLLSTAAALFALKTAKADLRIVAPACLNLIQNNYASGAFLAGNGDQVQDLEYTFYGLLALGTLTEDDHE